MDVDEAMDLLYAEPLATFTETRARLARQARSSGDPGLAAAVQSARKPTAAACAVNHLVRCRPEQVERLRSLAASLHEAQEQMDGRALKDLGRERTRLVDELVRSSGEVLGELGASLSPGVADQVRETLVAALATTTAAQAVTSGRLTRALSYAGFGDVDLSGATAVPPHGRRPALRVVPGQTGESPSPPGWPATEQTQDSGAPEGTTPEPVEPARSRPDPAPRERLATAAARSREARAAALTAGAELARLDEALDALDARVSDLETTLRTARAERDRLLATRKAAAAADRAAERTLRAALASLDEARAALPEADLPLA